MAFTGVAVVTKITDVLARITGLSLVSGAAGTISLFEGAGEVKLPDACNWAPYDPQKVVAGPSVLIDLPKSVQLMIVPVTDVSNFAIPIRVVKTGSGPTTFLATLTNDEGQIASPELEIYVRFH
jgi:hypothetical protein